MQAVEVKSFLEGKLPGTKVEVEGEGCSIGPNPVPVDKATAGKTIALFALPELLGIYKQ